MLWSLPSRIAFRFATCYFALFYVLPAPLLHPLDEWVGVGWLGVTPQLMNPAPSGSGDKTADWVHVFVVLILATAAALVWSVLDRKRKEYSTALGWSRLVFRYVLASVMLSYGFAKVFPTQFQPPTYDRLTERFGDFSPMGVLWSFMGASMGYTIFTGAVETLGGVLLLFRRTALVGALLTAAAMTNVFALNMFYDVPVKIGSLHHLMLALYIAAPDLGRLFRFVVLQRPSEPPSPAGPVFAKRDWRIVAWVAKGAFLLLFSVRAVSAYVGYTGRAAAVGHPLIGVYSIESAPAEVTWKQFTMPNPTFVRVRQPNGFWQTYRAVIDDGQSRLTLMQGGETVASLHYRISGDTVILEGDVRGNSAEIELRRSTEEFLLKTRGFHWINEIPFNR